MLHVTHQQFDNQAQTVAPMGPSMGVGAGPWVESHYSPEKILVLATALANAIESIENKNRRACVYVTVGISQEYSSSTFFRPSSSASDSNMVMVIVPPVSLTLNSSMCCSGMAARLADFPEMSQLVPLYSTASASFGRAATSSARDARTLVAKLMLHYDALKSNPIWELSKNKLSIAVSRLGMHAIWEPKIKD